MNKFSLIFSSLLLMTGIAHALDIPAGSSYDYRIKRTAYNPDDVGMVHSQVGAATHIKFGKGEVIKDMAMGNSKAWEIIDRENSIYLKPKLEKGANTNLMVVTDKRSYAFDLKLVPKNAKVAYRVEFTYPSEDAKAAEKRFSDNFIERSFNLNPSIVNSNYTMQLGKNSDSIKPVMAYDDSRFTYIKFERNKDMPVIYKVEDDKSETLINHHVKENYYVLHGVYKQLSIRAGKSIVGIWNESYSGGGKAAETGTISADVERVISRGEDE